MRTAQVALVVAVHAGRDGVVEQGDRLVEWCLQLGVIQAATSLYRHVDGPLPHIQLGDQHGQLAKVADVEGVHGGSHRHLQARLAGHAQSRAGAAEGPRPAHGIVACLEAVEAHLDLVHIEPQRRAVVEQRAVGAQHHAHVVARQHVVELPEERMQQGFAAGEDQAQAAARFELLQHAAEGEHRQVVAAGLAAVAVGAAEVAA